MTYQDSLGKILLELTYCLQIWNNINVFLVPYTENQCWVLFKFLFSFFFFVSVIRRKFSKQLSKTKLTSFRYNYSKSFLVFVLNSFKLLFHTFELVLWSARYKLSLPLFMCYQIFVPYSSYFYLIQPNFVQKKVIKWWYKSSQITNLLSEIFFRYQLFF